MSGLEHPGIPNLFMPGGAVPPLARPGCLAPVAHDFAAVLTPVDFSVIVAKIGRWVYGQGWRLAGVGLPLQ